MSTDETPDPAVTTPEGVVSRRGALRKLGAATAGGIGVAVGVNLLHASTAVAANDSPVLLGDDNTATATTKLTTSSGDGLLAYTTTTTGTGAIGVAGVDESSGGGYGLYGRSDQGVAVYGTGYTYGVYGTASGDYASGVYGTTGTASGAGVHGTASGDYGSGVYGNSSAFYGVGVLAETDSEFGTGVYCTSIGDSGTGLDSAASGTSCIGIRCVAGGTSSVGAYIVADGTALLVEGLTTFSRSGAATIAGKSGKTAQSITVTDVALTSSSMVLATPQGKVAGVAVEGVVTDVSNSSFTIYLTKAIKVSLVVAWFVIDLPSAGGAPSVRTARPVPARRSQRPPLGVTAKP